MIIITIDGLNWRVASELFTDLFQTQSTKKIYNDVRLYTQDVSGGSPTVVGLFCLWGGKRPRQFHPSIFAPIGQIKHGQVKPDMIM